MSILSLRGTVFFVSGFTGSNLYYPIYPLALGWLWPNPHAILLGGFAQLRMDVPGEGGGGSLSELLVPGGPILPYYGTLMGVISYLGYDVQTIAHDWRRPVAADGARLVAAIRANSRISTFFPKSVSIICHSRGGLVVRYALGVLAAAGELVRVRRVIGLGVPHQGSLLAVYNLGGPYAFTERLHHFSELGAQYSLGLLSLGDVQATLRSWRAIYELMPDPARNSLPTGVGAGLYVSANWAGVPQPPPASYLADTVASWAALPSPPVGVDWIDVAGVGLDTPVTGVSAEHIIGPDRDPSSLEGDGNVPLWSARQAGRRLVTTPTSHSMLVLDPRLYPTLIRALADGLSSDVALGGDVLREPGS